MRTNDMGLTRERERKKDAMMPNKAMKANYSETRRTNCLPQNEPIK